MQARNVRAALAADPDIGAGNVVATLMGLGDRGLADRREEPAIAFDTAAGGAAAFEPLTLAALDREVDRRAAALHSRGVGPRDPVAVLAGTAADTVLAFLALARLGAVAALVNPNVEAAPAAAYVDRLGAVGLVADATAAARLREHGLRTTVLAAPAELAGDGGGPVPRYRHHADDPVLVTHSSGTTGVPKAVTATHGSLFAAIRYRLGLPRPRGYERLLSALPPSHNSAVTAVNLSLCTGAPILMLSSQSGAAVLDGVARWQPTAVAGFAATWAELAATDLDAGALEGVSVWWNSGDCAHEPHIRRLMALGHREVATAGGVQRRPGSQFVDGLGSSEMGHSLFVNVHEPGTQRYDRCIGRPHAFASATVLGPDGEDLPPGEVGLLGVRSASLTPGYWNDSVTTYRARLRGWFLTGDLVYRDDDGRYYHVDRVTDAVRGEGVAFYTALAEERVLARCPGVADCTVVATTEAGRVVVDVLLVGGPGSPGGADAERDVRAALADWGDLVRRVVVAAPGDVPLGPTGKVRKRLLRERLRSAALPGQAGRP